MNSDFSQQRNTMVEGQLRTRDVTNVPVLNAFRAVPRETFIPEARRSLSYMDEDLELPSHDVGIAPRYMMEPAVLALLLQLGGLKSTDLVLDVGCTTGYSTAIIAHIASFVVGLEVDPVLAEMASAALAEHDYGNVSVAVGPLEAGYAAHAPYDLIVLQGSVEFVPDSLLNQLGEGGRLVAVIGKGNSAQAYLFIKSGGVISQRPDFNAAIRPIPGFVQEKGFVF